MINDWINRNDIEKTTEAVLLFLYLLRAATAQQLAALLGLQKRTVVHYIYKMNQQEYMIRAYRLGTTGERVYVLMPKGVEVVAEILGDVKYYTISKRQGKHWRGLHDILLRLIRIVGLQEFGHNLTWYTANQAKKFLFEQWNQWCSWDAKQRLEEYQDMLSPDARLDVLGEGCWIEYDCGNERKPAIRANYLGYIDQLVVCQI